MIDTTIFPRLLEPHVVEALARSPAVLIQGPRQCGKTTLARMVGASRGYKYVSLDDDAVRAAARDDPFGFAANLPARIIVDEVRRAPALRTALKREIDRWRTPGRFLLTASTDAPRAPDFSDSLAGRSRTLRLHPLAQCELERSGPGFLDALFAGEFAAGRTCRLGGELPDRIAAGGYPAALARPAGRRRAQWYEDHLDALVQRDIRDLARIRRLDIVPRLFATAAGRSGKLFNLSELAAPFQVSRPTIRDYAGLLERAFLLERLPAWNGHRMRRLVKRPKLHLCDTGVASALLALDGPALAYDRTLFGQLLETFVFQELRRQASGRDAPVSFHHLRDRDGAEVDLVIQRGATRVAGVRVKASGTVRRADFRGLRKLRAALPDRFAGGVVLYDGEVTEPLGDRLHAVPLRHLFSGVR